jgi:AraC-like DNA-binding protein
MHNASGCHFTIFLWAGGIIFGVRKPTLMNSFARFGDTIILMGIIQGFILSVLLFVSRKRSPANRFLAWLILLITTASFNLYMLDVKLPDITWVNIVAACLPLVVVMPMGPLIWFYVQGSLDADFRFTKKHRLHFLPAAIDFFPYAFLLLVITFKLMGLVSSAQRTWVSDFIDAYNVYSDIPRWLSITVYCWLAYRYIQQRKQQGQPMSATTAKWLQQFLLLFLVFQLIWLAYLVPYVIPATRDWLLDTVDWYPVYIPLAIMVYWLGLKGYLITHRQQSGVHPKHVTPVPRLPQNALEQAVQQLRTAMERDQLYLDPALNVNLLAQHTGIAPKTVSAVLNQHLDKSFSSFVNEYRVQAFKQRVQEPVVQVLTITGIAMECGFSSTATFQRIFKQLTGLSPSAWMQQSKMDEVQ